MKKFEKQTKKSPIRFRLPNESGIILLIVLWMVIILTVLALGLGRRASVEVALTKYSLEQLKADYLAKAGIHFAFDQLKKDTEDPDSSTIDTLLWCGLKPEKDKLPDQIFRNVSLGEGSFEIAYREKNPETQNTRILFGFEDEERKINLNALDHQSRKVLEELIVLLGFNPEAAQMIGASIVDWVDADSFLSDPTFGAEKDYYEGLSKPYPCKNAMLDSLEELLLVRGMTEEIFLKIKDYVTVFPKVTNELVININTASEVVLKAFYRAFAGAGTQTTLDDAESLVRKMMIFRSGEDGVPATLDDRLINFQGLALNAKEAALYNSFVENTRSVSHYFHMNVRGTCLASKVKSEIRAIIKRDDYSIVAWQKK